MTHTIQITFDKLKAMMGEAFECGYRGSLQTKEQEIDNLFEKYEISSDGGFRIWEVDELRKLPEGTIFDHLTMGRCFVVSRKEYNNLMQFDKGMIIEFNTNGSPWNVPMRIVHKP